MSSRDLSCWMKLCPFRVYLYRCTCTLVHTHTHTSTHEHTYVRSTIDRAKAINTNEKSSQLPSPRHFFKRSQLLNETLPISCLFISLHMYFGAHTHTQAHMNTHTSGAQSTERKPSTQMRSHLSCRVHDISSRDLSCWMKLCPFRVYLYCCTCTLVHAHAHKHTWTHIRQEHDRQSESHQHKWEVISAAESTTLLQEISAAEWNSAHFVSIYIAAHVLWCTHTHTSTHEHTYVRSTIDRAKAINTNEKSSQLPSPRHFFKKSQLLNETLPISCLFILLHMYFGARTRTQAHMNTHTSGARSTERKPSTQMRSHLSCRVHDIASRNLSCWMKLCPFRVYLYCCTCTLVHAHAHKHTWTHIRQEHDRQSESHQHKWEVISAAESTTFLQEISAAEWNSAHFVSIYIAAHVLWCTHTHTSTHEHTYVRSTIDRAKAINTNEKSSQLPSPRHFFKKSQLLNETLPISCLFILLHMYFGARTRTQAHMNTHTSGARSTERKPSTQMRSHLSCRVHDISSRDLSCWMKLCPFRVYLYCCTCTLVHAHTHTQAHMNTHTPPFTIRYRKIMARRLYVSLPLGLKWNALGSDNDVALQSLRPQKTQEIWWNNS